MVNVLVCLSQTRYRSSQLEKMLRDSSRSEHHICASIRVLWTGEKLWHTSARFCARANTLRTTIWLVVQTLQVPKQVSKRNLHISNPRSQDRGTPMLTIWLFISDFETFLMHMRTARAFPNSNRRIANIHALMAHSIGIYLPSQCVEDIHSVQVNS